MNTKEEHDFISSRLISGKHADLIKKYGSVKNAEARLHELEHILNFGSLKGFKSKGY